MGRELEVGLIFWVDVDDKRLHVASGLLLCQWVIFHVLTCIGSSVRETDATLALALFCTANYWTQSVVVIHECAKSYS